MVVGVIRDNLRFQYILKEALQVTGALMRYFYIFMQGDISLLDG